MSGTYDGGPQCARSGVSGFPPSRFDRTPEPPLILTLIRRLTARRTAR